MTIKALTLQEAADRLGLSRSTLRTYRFPDPDVQIGRIVGWLPQTVDEWQANRPGRGARTDLA